MTKRVLGVLAALSMVVGSVACSSSSSSGTPAAATDAGKDSVINRVDGGSCTKDADCAATPTTPLCDPTTKKCIAEPPTPKTTGKECKTADDCDPEGLTDGFAFCSNAAYAVGPLNPTPICFLYNPAEDVCQATDDTTIRFCDGGTGLCTKSGDQKSACEAMCQFDSTGKSLVACAGKNSCNPSIFGTDNTMKVVGIGTCQGGCDADADCPSGSKCDPLQKFCIKTCTANSGCTYTGSPATYQCDTARGACTFKYPKNVGDACATADDCLCFKNTADAGGYCVGLCKTGGAACGSGTTCDALLPLKDKMGADIWSFTAGQPAGLAGYCLKNCTADTDCVAGQACEASAGVTQKTCRPKSTAM